MATVQTIATTLTADAKPFARGMREAEKSAELLGGRLERLDRDWQRKMDNLSRTPAGGGGRGAQGLLELSRGVEDAAAGFGTNGLQGAVRGSLNNITAFATMVGGPVAGAVAGFAAGGLSILVNSFWKSRDAAKEAEAALKSFGDQLTKHQELAKEGAVFSGTLEDTNSVDSANQKIKERERRLQSIEDENAALQQQRDAESRRRNEAMQLGIAGFGGPQTRFGQATGQDLLGNDTSKLDESIKRDQEIHEKQMKLLEERAKAEEELNQLFDTRNQLREKEQTLAEIDSLGKSRPEEDVRLKGIENSLMGAEQEEQRLMMSERRQSGGGGSQSVAPTVAANSQSLARVQAAAKEAAKAAADRAKQLAEAQKQTAALRDIKRQLESGQDIGDVNIP